MKDFKVTQPQEDLHTSTADVSSSAVVGASTKIWPLAQVRENVLIGEECVIGRAVYIGGGTTLGNRVKVQNNALIYGPAKIGDGVFIGPGVILTNDKYPRAINPDETLKSKSDWIPVGVEIAHGASIGAGAICVAPVKIREWSVVAAGSVVIKDVNNFEIVAGSPAKRIGWSCMCGRRLVEKKIKRLMCMTCFREYKLILSGDDSELKYE